MPIMHTLYPFRYVSAASRASLRGAAGFRERGCIGTQTTASRGRGGSPAGGAIHAFSVLLGRRYNLQKRQGERTDLTSPQGEDLKTAARIGRRAQGWGDAAGTGAGQG